MATPNLKEYVTHVVGHEKELVSDAFRKRSIEIQSEGESSQGKKDGKNVTSGGSDVITSQTTTNIPQTHIFTINLEENEPKENTTTTTTTTTAAKVTSLLPPKRQFQLKQVMMEKESVDIVRSSVTSSSKVVNRDKGATIHGKEEEPVVTLPQMTVAGDGQQYVLGL